MKKSTTKVTIIVICLIVALVGYYAYLSNQTKERKAEASLSEVQSVLSRDLKNDYPSTPKEVIKYYNEIIKCFYNEECTDDEIDDLGNKARELYDAELLEENELGEYMVRLRAEIKEYKDKKRRITSSTVAASTSVDYFSENGYDFARIMAGYNVMEGGVNYQIKHIYLLRRDENKKWKIYGWEVADDSQASVDSPQ